MFQRILLGLIGTTLILWAAFWIYTATLGMKSLGAPAVLHTDRTIVAYPECRKCDTSELMLTLASDSSFALVEITTAPDTLVRSGAWRTDSRRLALYTADGEVLDYYLAVDGALQYIGADSLLPVHTFPAKE
jgi:hypothetical protein